MDLPPEIDKGETGIFQSDPSKTLAAYQRDLEESGQIDLGRKVEVTAEELEVFSMLLLSLNRKKCPLKTLILDNCDLTDEKLVGFYSKRGIHMESFINYTIPICHSQFALQGVRLISQYSGIRRLFMGCVLLVHFIPVFGNLYYLGRKM